ncbi:hypothetical protein IFM89_001013 [Coptis chinensis]|uniref:Uncharacterized protein n=1 Tax=Coptis chinensis TaxID=261450 RepID=A0A835IKT1_9MAGN|nr:hypothetical protein IFM89_001013 [Coptis chinensis]
MTKMAVKYTVVDAFTDTPFKGNPAAVCILEEERDDEWLQAVAKEFNVSQTCYLTRINTESVAEFSLRWFTPVAEVNLCGHATLAAAHVLFTSGLITTNIIEFSTLSGILTAKRVPRTGKSEPPSISNGNAEDRFSIELDFPTVSVVECDPSEIPSIPLTLNGAQVVNIKKMATSGDLIVELSTGKSVSDLQPNFDEIHKCPGRGIIVTGIAPSGSGFDFFSRFFCPKLGINEEKCVHQLCLTGRLCALVGVPSNKAAIDHGDKDPVCGSAHCGLAPYWSKKLGKSDFMAYMASPRGGILELHFDEAIQRMLIRGEAVTVMEGSLFA